MSSFRSKDDPNSPVLEPRFIFELDVHGHYARNVIDANLKLSRLRLTGKPLPEPVSPRSFTLQAELPPSDNQVPVGILGAGVGGLYTALMLEDLGIPYKIIEAQDRLGGRLYTHKFYNETGKPYNYFDVGAMRFPDIPAMTRVFDLFKYPPLNSDGIALQDRLKPFYFDGALENNTFFSYNGVTLRQNAVTSAGEDPFFAKTIIWDTNPDPYIAAGAKAIVDDVIKPFAERLRRDLDLGRNEGWDYLRSYDHYSTRSYMQTSYLPSAALQLPSAHLPTDVVNWCETFGGGTGWYDRALSETVLEAVAFGWSPDAERTNWFCIDGGANEIAQDMAKYIRSRRPDAIDLNTRVTAINSDPVKRQVQVITEDSKTYQFSHVISTIPLPVLRTLDLSQAGLSNMQANALRELNYGPSVKIGLQFKTAWWTTATNLKGEKLNIIGGQSYTDRPLRTIVYPSFGDVIDGKTTTLIASYCWTEDAERLGALVSKDKLLKDLVLRELADIHSVSKEFLHEELIDCKAWSWSHDPNVMGAFAFFGPGKFGNLYTSLCSPAAAGRLHFAGEAISIRHAWVEGALDSAWRAVNEMLLVSPTYRRRLQYFHNRWGANPEWVVPPDNHTNAEPVLDVHDMKEWSLLLQHLAKTNPELFSG